MIVETIHNEYQFAEAFRQIRPDNFSYDGLKALFEYLDCLSDDIGQPIELDVIAICCDFSEYTFDELFREYGNYYDIVKAGARFVEYEHKGFTVSRVYGFDFSDYDDVKEKIIDHFSDYTTVIRVDDDTVIIQSF